MVKRFAIVKNNVVVNCAHAKEPLEANWVEAPVANIGDLYDGASFSPPPVDQNAVREAMVCTLTQFLTALDDVGRLEETEAAIALAPKKIRLIWEHNNNIRRKGKLVDYLRT